MTRRCLVALAFGASALLGTSRDAAAQGFGVYEQSACAMALGGASVAAPCKDGSAIFFNPAAIAGQLRVAGLGTTFIAPVGGFTDSRTGQQSDLLDRVYPVPNVYFIQPFKGTMAFGLGLFAPYGLSTEWQEDTSQGRFLRPAQGRQHAGRIPRGRDHQRQRPVVDRGPLHGAAESRGRG